MTSAHIAYLQRAAAKHRFDFKHDSTTNEIILTERKTGYGAKMPYTTDLTAVDMITKAEVFIGLICMQS